MNRHHPDAVAVLFENRRLCRHGVLGGHAQLVHEAPKRDASACLELARELRDVKSVGERLLASCAQREADVRARRAEELVQRLRDRHVVAPAVEPLEEHERISDWTQVGDLLEYLAVERRRHAERVQMRTSKPLRRRQTESMRPFEERLVSDGEERSSQRREHRQLVVGPLDRGKRRADGLDFLPLVKRLAADEHVRDRACFECFDVRSCDVVLPADEAAEQKADVLGRDRDGSLPAAFRHHPSALAQHPLDEGARRRWAWSARSPPR